MAKGRQVYLGSEKGLPAVLWRGAKFPLLRYVWQGSTWEAREHEKDVQCKVHVLEIARLRRAMRRRRIVAGAK